MRIAVCYLNRFHFRPVEVDNEDITEFNLETLNLFLEKFNYEIKSVTSFSESVATLREGSMNGPDTISGDYGFIATLKKKP